MHLCTRFKNWYQEFLIQACKQWFCATKPPLRLLVGGISPIPKNITYGAELRVRSKRFQNKKKTRQGDHAILVASLPGSIFTGLDSAVCKR